MRIFEYFVTSLKDQTRSSEMKLVFGKNTLKTIRSCPLFTIPIDFEKKYVAKIDGMQ